MESLWVGIKEQANLGDTVVRVFYGLPVQRRKLMRLLKTAEKSLRITDNDSYGRPT